MNDKTTDMDRGWLRRRIALAVKVDWRWKVLSLLLAGVFYFMIRDIIRHDKTLTIPVDIDPRSGIAVATIEPLSVEVTIQGTINDLQQFTDNNPRFIVRPTYSGKSTSSIFEFPPWLLSVLGYHVDGDTETFKLGNRQLQGGKGRARITKIEPKKVKVFYDVSGAEDLEVAEPQLKGRPYRGHAEISYFPKKVRVTGSAAQVAMMAENGVQLQVEPIEVEGRVQGFKKAVPILQPGLTRLVKFDPPEVVVEVKIVTDRFVQEFTGMPVLLATQGNNHFCVAADPAVVDVKLSGRSETINQLQTNQVTAIVDVRSYQTQAPTNRLPVSLLIPYDFSIETVEIVPPDVLVVTAITSAPPCSVGFDQP